MTYKEWIKQREMLESSGGSGIIRVEKTTLFGKPNSITEVVHKQGGIDRNYYDENQKWIKQISNNDHGNATMHPFGKNGEHAHDIIWKDGKIVQRRVRELTEQERRLQKYYESQ